MRLISPRNRAGELFRYSRLPLAFLLLSGFSILVMALGDRFAFEWLETIAGVGFILSTGVMKLALRISE